MLQQYDRLRSFHSRQIKIDLVKMSFVWYEFVENWPFGKYIKEKNIVYRSLVTLSIIFWNCKVHYILTAQNMFHAWLHELDMFPFAIFPLFAKLFIITTTWVRQAQLINELKGVSACKLRYFYILLVHYCIISMILVTLKS